LVKSHGKRGSVHVTRIALATILALAVLTDGWRVAADAGVQGNVSLPNLNDPGDALEWTLPDAWSAGLYLPLLDVRTGDRGEGVSFIELYRLGVPERALPRGASSHPLTFRRNAQAPPKMVTQGEGWQVWRGQVPATEAVWLRAGDRLRVWATGHWMNCWGVHLRALDPQRVLFLNLRTEKPANLFRLGEPVCVLADVVNGRSQSASVEVRAIVKDERGVKRGSAARRVTLPSQSRRAVTLNLRLDERHRRGAFFAHVKYVLGATESESDVLGFGVTDAPDVRAVSPDSFFGIHKGETDPWPAIGVRWNRLWDTGHSWMTVEREPGVFDWSRLDQAVDGAAKNGVRLLYVLAYTPRFYSARPDEANGGRSAEPKDIAVWRRFVHEVAGRYRGRMEHFEVWNEPNTGFFTGTPQAYFALLQAAYAEVKSANPRAVVLGISGTGSYLPWMEEVFKLGGLRFMDVVSVHTYTNPSLPEEANLVGRLQGTRRLIERYGGSQPLWNTETGTWVVDRNADGSLPTAADIVARAPAVTRPNWFASWPSRPLDESTAAAYLTRHCLLNWSQGVERIFWFFWQAHMHAMVTARDEPCLHTIALGALVGQLHGARYLRREDLGMEAVHVHVFARGDQRIVAAWTTREQPQRVSLAAGPITVCDVWGNPARAASEDGRATVELDALPVYLHGLTDQAVASVRLADAEITLPPDDAEVLADIGEKNVRNFTSPAHHGERRVFSLGEPGDSIGWRLRGIAPRFYEVRLDVQTGSALPGGNLMSSYQLTHTPAEGAPQVFALQLAPGESPQQTHANAQGQGDIFYAATSTSQPLVLRPGDLLAVISSAHWAHVGRLGLRFLRDAPEYSTLAVTGLPANMQVDGDLSDWPDDALRLRIERRRQVVIGVADPFASTDENDLWRGPEDCSAVARVGVRADGLWVAVEVTDDIHRPSAGQPYNGDAAELFLDLRPFDRLHAAELERGVAQISLVPPLHDGSSDVARGPLAAGVDAAARRTPTGYLIEARVPWSLSPSGKAPDTFGFDIAIDDSDAPPDQTTSRKAQIMWRGRADNFRNPKMYGTLRAAGH